jgi:hypothetical protein
VLARTIELDGVWVCHLDLVTVFVISISLRSIEVGERPKPTKGARFANTRHSRFLFGLPVLLRRFPIPLRVVRFWHPIPFAIHRHLLPLAVGALE